MAGDHSVQARITSFWDTIATDYEAHPGNVPGAASAERKAWVEAIRELLPPSPADVLDIGTGTGFVALIAAELGHRVVGIDLADSMLAEAKREMRRHGLSVRFERSDAVAPGLAPASFDAVVCRHFLWTLREPETALVGWRDLLRPEGRVVAIDGHWFRDEQPDPGGGIFVRHYTRETRAALPLMAARDPRPVVATFERAGFADVWLSYLASVHALAEDPPSEEPWYVVVARKSGDHRPVGA